MDQALATNGILKQKKKKKTKTKTKTKIKKKKYTNLPFMPLIYLVFTIITSLPPI